MSKAYYINVDVLKIVMSFQNILISMHKKLLCRYNKLIKCSFYLQNTIKYFFIDEKNI